MNDAPAAGQHPRHLRRFVAIADSDSYVKWAAALLGSLTDVDARVLLVRTPLTVSAEQERAALAGSGLEPARVEVTDYPAVSDRVRELAPDAVFVAGRGPFVRIVMRAISAVSPRPVVVVGLPGMSIPAQRGAVHYRRDADLFLVHSRRELRAFSDLAGRMGVPMRFALATLPFARPRQRSAPAGHDLVFAAQAVVPRALEDRRELADILRRAALANPLRRVVVKLRSRAELGERETHHEIAGYPELIAELGERPANLVFSYASMRSALETAEGLVTVSSTAAIEAVAQGVPVLALDTFGISKANLNTVFAASGLLGDASDVIARRFRQPSAQWVNDNYFHSDEGWTWVRDVDELVDARRARRLAQRTAPRGVGGSLREAWDRKVVLGSLDRTMSGTIALLIGTPLRWGILTLRKRRSPAGAHTWAESGTDITLSPAPHQEPLRRERRSAPLLRA